MPNASHARSSAPAQRRMPGWMWLLTGLALGLVIALVRPGGGPAPEEGATPLAALRDQGAAQRPQAPPPADPAAGAGPAEEFTFYKMLPRMEVPTAGEPLPARDAPEATPATPAPGTDTASGQGAFVVQVGAFRTYADADRLKARLALLGLEARIQTATVSGQGTRHRVRLGPFADRSAVEQVRHQLQEVGMKAFVLQVPA